MILEYLKPKHQKELWKYMDRECVARIMPASAYSEREMRLSEIREQVETGHYYPKGVAGFLSAPKHAGVPRFIPVLSHEDIAVYFACVRSFDDDISSDAAPDTFGAWTLGGQRARNEQQRLRTIFDEIPQVEDLPLIESIPVSPYNKFAWVASWQQYYNILQVYLARFRNQNSRIVTFDVANFYDSIDLIRLEREVRRLGKGRSLSVEVLFYLLTRWNKRMNRYASTSKGIPMDVVGDCSRVLANFYLNPFDHRAQAMAGQVQSQFIRFADDMIFICPNESSCRTLIFKAAEELNSIGLNINVSKVHYYSVSEFERLWRFDIMNQLTENTIIRGITDLANAWSDRSYGKKYMALKRAISLIRKFPVHTQWQRWVYDRSMENSAFVCSLADSHLLHLINIAPNKAKAIGRLIGVINQSHFTQPKITLLRALENANVGNNLASKTHVQNYINILIQSQDPILNMTIRSMPVDTRQRLGLVFP